MEMTKKRLEAYRSEKQEIEELKHKLQNLKTEDYVGNSVINDYRSGFPSPQSVVGTDMNAYLIRQSRLKTEITRLERRCLEIEQWIDAIPDSLTRRMFRLYFVDGKNQKDIAEQIHIDRSVISRKINNYIQRCEKVNMQ